MLEITEAVENLAAQFMLKSNLPTKASDDAIHIALATVNNLDYLLTWNCKHIANAQIQKKLLKICLDKEWREEHTSVRLRLLAIAKVLIVLMTVYVDLQKRNGIIYDNQPLLSQIKA